MGWKEHIFLGVLMTLLSYSKGITVSSNGNTPTRKMISVDMKNIEFGGFVPINPYKKSDSSVTTTEKKNLNYTTLPVNERYRRLIPYMTFYLANDFNNPQTEVYSAKVEPERVVVQSNGKLTTSHYNNIPRYQGNRLTNFNIASAYPSKIAQEYYPQKLTNHLNYASNQRLRYPQSSNVSPLQDIMLPPKVTNINNFDFQRPIPVPVKVSPTNYYKSPETAQVQYYVKPETGRPKTQQYKLVPYEQTPPLQIPLPNNSDDYFLPKLNPHTNTPIPVPVQAKGPYQQNYYDVSSPEVQYYNSNDQKEQNDVYSSYSPLSEEQQQKNLKSQIVYQPDKNFNLRKPSVSFNPITESGFKPMVNTGVSTPQTKFEYITTTPYSPTGLESEYDDYSISTQKPKVQYKPRPTKRPTIYTESPEDYADISPNLNNYESTSDDIYEENNLAKILKTLQQSNSLPQTLTTDNIDSSIKTLVQILNNLKKNQNYIESSTPVTILSTPTPFKIASKPLVKVNNDVHAPRYSSRIRPNTKVVPVLKPLPVHEYPPQDLEKEHLGIQGLGSNQDYLAGENELGGTPGKPGIDYPILSVIPSTQFDCKTQRYKGFFGDPETNCQVWHYCDLNGGQASFLCPNGTIFSQVALTCDWWFNVKCDSTAQLYVLNERLYKYILPYTPKFPEDYSGPLVDKYLTIKYKELEEKMKKQKKTSKPESEEVTTTDKENINNMETEKAEMIEINTSGMSGALRHYGE